MTAAVGVVIIDESEALDPSLRAALEHEPALYTVGETGSVPAVALVVLPDSGFTPTLERLATLKRARADVKVLLAFQSLDSATLSSLLAAGADAVVARQSTPREVCAALLGLMQPAQRLAADDRDGAESLDGAEGLTPREAEILRFLSAGFSNKEVARRLSLSVRTVETHRLNLRRKTQTGRLKDLVALARKLGLKPVVDADTRRSGTDGAVSVSRPTMNAAAPW
ncbi:response regulator transcription factor [Methylobacterium sp. Leaf466]|uniref:LuxR C-terminal-related transcriptional regulator n=1 Tax=Methylobacterium sp. Leaf466 TaxID=1736386 RepID=UPI0006FDA985|nr:response regulator transcription factor [Methylobacterium sp. Leaf466]KQT78276.1 LuxR family transcriptional regulator [Methylobacterium sp. Leaf466]